MAIHHIAVIGGRNLVYVDAREEHLSTDEARQLAAKLVDLADGAEDAARIVTSAIPVDNA